MARDARGFAPIRDAESARYAIDRFGRFPKLLSWLVLHSAELPTLSGVIVSRWDLDVARGVEEFASALDSNRLLMRSDSSAESGHSPRGGYLIALAQLEAEVRPLLEQGRIVFLLEPSSPFDDLYSMSLQPDLDWQEWQLDVVGSGFDASDLKRGDVTPHEQVRAHLGRNGVMVLERVVAQDDVFRASRAIRLEKAARMLGCSPEDAPTELRELGETMLLDIQTYRPIPDEALIDTIDDAMGLRQELVSRRLDDRHVAISASLLGYAGRRVFWDIVWPRSKYRIGDE